MVQVAVLRFFHWIFSAKYRIVPSAQLAARTHVTVHCLMGLRKMLHSLLCYLSKKLGCTRRKIIDTKQYIHILLLSQLTDIEVSFWPLIGHFLQMAINCTFPRIWHFALLVSDRNCVKLPRLLLEEVSLSPHRRLTDKLWSIFRIWNSCIYFGFCFNDSAVHSDLRSKKTHIGSVIILFQSQLYYFQIS